MQNQRPGERGWGLAQATRQLIDSAGPAETARRNPQVDRALASFLDQPAGSTAESNDALADQQLILAHHFGVDESFFTDPAVAEKLTAERRRRAASGESDTPRVGRASGAGGSSSTGGRHSAATDDEPETVEAGRPRKLAGVALVSVGLLAGAAVGGAVGYHAGTGAGRHQALAAEADRSAQSDRSEHRPGAMDDHGDHRAPMGGSPQEIAARVQPAVAQVRVHAGTANLTGSGVVLTPDGLLLTNNHVVAAAARGGEITVAFQNGITRPAHIVGRDAASDVAVLAADNVNGLTPARLGNSDTVRVGEHVVALGSPAGPDGTTVTSGVVSAINHAVLLGHDEATKAPEVLNAIQTDTMVSAVNSGGPLVDSHGLVIGIDTLVPGAPAAAPGATGPGATGPGAVAPGQAPAQAQAAKFGYAIPANQAGRIAEHLIDASRGIPTALGVRVGAGNRPTQANGAAGAAEPAGAKIMAVAPGSPAGNAGLKVGDVVDKINGHPVTSGVEFATMTRSLAPGDSVNLLLGDGRSTHVVLPPRPVAVSKPSP